MHTDSSSAELEAIARQALASFESRRSLLGLFQKRSPEYFEAVAALRAFVRQLDPNRFNEESLSEVVAVIGRIVTFLEGISRDSRVAYGRHATDFPRRLDTGSQRHEALDHPTVLFQPSQAAK